MACARELTPSGCSAGAGVASAWEQRKLEAGIMLAPLLFQGACGVG